MGSPSLVGMVDKGGRDSQMVGGAGRAVTTGQATYGDLAGSAGARPAPWQGPVPVGQNVVPSVGASVVADVQVIGSIGTLMEPSA